MPVDQHTSALWVGEVERVLGRIRGSSPGPTLLGTAGLHGNEPAGILAFQRVLRTLEGSQDDVSGDFVALSGNRAALREGRRYLSRDLNRAWATGPTGAPREAEPGANAWEASDPESREQLELSAALEEAIAGSRGAVFFLDLHTTSGPSAPFSTIVENSACRRFARNIPVPLVVGLVDQLGGTLLGFLAERGISGVVLEGGQHSNPTSVEASEAGIWLALSAAGVIRESVFPQVEQGRRLLAAATKGIPPLLEVSHKHSIHPDDDFQMAPGFRNFQPVEMGEVLARDRRGPVRAPRTGRILMPLYQAKGVEGFFLVRNPSP